MPDETLPKPAFYPAPGNRGYEHGKVRSVGHYGCSWSSSASGNNGYYLDFNTSRIVPNNGHDRANGLQLRCLQE